MKYIWVNDINDVLARSELQQKTFSWGGQLTLPFLQIPADQFAETQFSVHLQLSLSVNNEL